MADLIQVIGTRAGQVGLWERHPDQPGGEIYVTGDAVVTVARTPRVVDALRLGTLVEVPPVPAEAEAEAETEPEAPPTPGKTTRRKRGKSAS